MSSKIKSKKKQQQEAIDRQIALIEAHANAAIKSQTPA